MNIRGNCKTVSRGCIAMAVVMLLLAASTTLYADDKDKDKAKKKDSTPAKSAPAQKASPPAEKQKTAAPTRTEGANTRVRSGGDNTAAKGAGTSTTTKTGEPRTGANNGGTNTTGGFGGAHKDRKTAGATTGNTGGSGAGSSSVGTNTADKDKSGKHTPNNTGGSGASGSSVGTNTVDKDKSGKHTSNNTGGTGAAGSGVGTNTTDKDKSGKHAPNNTGGTGAGGSGVGTNTTDKSGKHSTVNTGSANTTGDSGGANTPRKGGKTGDKVGSADKAASAGRPVITRGDNGKTERFRGRDGAEARFRRDGSVREVHAREMTIIHGPGGSRRIVVERGDHSRVVAYRGGYGYVQRPFVYRGHEFASRTYLYHGRPYAAYYQRYPYRGVFLEGYRPNRYYRPAFYGWAYNPWRSPVRYSWGWGGSPWYGYYGNYFTPYAAYPSASFWLTDYFIAASLQAAYQQRADSRAYAVANPGDPVVLTPEVKEAIANEVQSQLALENSESQTAARGGDLDVNSSGLPLILAEASPNHPHVFVVAGPLEVTDSAGQECGLTAGDVLRLITAPPPDSTSVYLQVFASKNQECPRGATVSVGLADLQEMQNHMRASIDQGLQELQSHEGGLPAPPPGAAASPMQASFAAIAPPADPNVSNVLQQQAQDADTAEQKVLDEAKQQNSEGAGNTDAPVEISLGQTTEEVMASLGNPKQIVNLGTKKIYVYADLKITFINGKVSNVE